VDRHHAASAGTGGDNQVRVVQARFDKHGRRVPDSGHGCGCTMCAAANAPRYERRQEQRLTSREWTSLRRRLARVIRSFGSQRPRAAD
jgi:hypothetical protein